MRQIEKEETYNNIFEKHPFLPEFLGFLLGLLIIYHVVDGVLTRMGYNIFPSMLDLPSLIPRYLK